MPSSPYVKMPGARLKLPQTGAPLQSIGCCGAPQATGSSGGVATGVIFVGAALGLLLLFPKAWGKFTKELWG